MSQIEQVSGLGIPLLIDDIDTDRIIPARYLRCVTFDGLGEYAFEDDRKQDPDHPLDDPRFVEGTIMVSGRNFGCGSSREHAPQALKRRGIQACIAESFAEIFFGNCTSLGMPAVCLSRADLESLCAKIQEQPDLSLTIDLKGLRVQVEGGESYSASMPENARQALLSGQYDFLSQLLDAKADIQQTAEALPYWNSFA